MVPECGRCECIKLCVVNNELPEHWQTERLYLGNMLSDCCIKVIGVVLREAGFIMAEARLGEVVVAFDPQLHSVKEIERLLSEEGFPVLLDRDQRIVMQIRQAVIDLVYYSTYNAMVRNSDYLVERFDMSYPYMSQLFSRVENLTLEKFIIYHKIERVKQLLQEGSLTLSEIAFMMGYSSVQYLSTQFKNVAGVSVSDYKKDPARHRVSIEKVGKPRR